MRHRAGSICLSLRRLSWCRAEMANLAFRRLGAIAVLRALQPDGDVRFVEQSSEPSRTPRSVEELTPRRRSWAAPSTGSPPTG